MKKYICMIVPSTEVKGGIAAVVQGYKHSDLVNDYSIVFIESYKDGSKISKLKIGISAYLKYIKLLILDKPEIIHIHSSFGTSFYRKLPFILLSRWFGVSIINHIHGSAINEFYFEAGKFKRWLVRKIYNCCDEFIVLSNYWKQILIDIVPKKNINVISNYAPTICNDTGLRSVQVLYMGMLEEEKGCYDMPEIIAQVCSVIKDCHFILAGIGKIEELKEMFTKKGVLDSVSFPGWIQGPEKEKLLKESMIFFLPSYHEGMPMAILEAMGFGMPIVATRVGGIPDLVIEGKNGILCDPRDIRVMSESLIRLLKDKETCGKMGKESLGLVKREYSLDKHVELLEKVYEHVLASRGENG